MGPVLLGYSFVGNPVPLIPPAFTSVWSFGLERSQGQGLAAAVLVGRACWRRAYPVRIASQEAGAAFPCLSVTAWRHHEFTCALS